MQLEDIHMQLENIHTQLDIHTQLVAICTQLEDICIQLEDISACSWIPAHSVWDTAIQFSTNPCWSHLRDIFDENYSFLRFCHYVSSTTISQLALLISFQY